MNILLYSHSFLPKIGGREIVVYQLGKALSQLDHSVRVVGPRWSRASSQTKFDIPVHRYPRLTRNIVRGGQFSQRLAELEMSAHLMLDTALYDCDIIHAHSLYPAGYIAVKALRHSRKNIPLIATPHGIDINTVPESNYGLRLQANLADKIDMTLSQADAITAISRGIQHSLIEAKTPPAKIHRIANGIDIARFNSHQRLDARARLGIPATAKILLTVGNYAPLKGHQDLIRAMPQIVTRNGCAHLVIVGAGSEALHPVISACETSNNITLTGSIGLPGQHGGIHKDDDLLAALYQQSTLYVSASNQEGAEGLSLSLLDAMAAGLPVIGTDITGNRDLIQHGQNGFLFPINESQRFVEHANCLLEDEELCASFGRVSKKTASEYDWKNIARHYVALYESCVDKKNNPPGVPC